MIRKLMKNIKSEDKNDIITLNDDDTQSNIIIYNTLDGKSSVALYATDGKIWLNQKQMAELFATSKQIVSYHINNILKDNELNRFLVIKDFLTTATDRKQYHIVFYALEMILAVGYRVKGVRGIQFRQWATRHLLEADQDDVKMLEEITNEIHTLQ